MAIKDNLDWAVEVFIFEEGLAASTARADRKGLEGEAGRLGFVGTILGSCGNSNFLHGDTGKKSRSLITGGSLGTKGGGEGSVFLIATAHNLAIVEENCGSDMETGIGGIRGTCHLFCHIYEMLVLVGKLGIIELLNRDCDGELFHDTKVMNYLCRAKIIQK